MLKPAKWTGGEIGWWVNHLVLALSEGCLGMKEHTGDEGEWGHFASPLPKPLKNLVRNLKNMHLVEICCIFVTAKSVSQSSLLWYLSTAGSGSVCKAWCEKYIRTFPNCQAYSTCLPFIWVCTTWHVQINIKIGIQFNCMCSWYNLLIQIPSLSRR